LSDRSKTAAGACVIRRATPQDAEAISRVVIRTLRETNAADYTPEEIDAVAANFSPESARARFSTRAVFVALLGGRIVGTASLDGSTVRTVFVDPEAQSRGIGARLMEAVQALAVADGVSRLLVPSSVTAEAFYRKLGFTSIRDEYHGTERTILMEKLLS
jgi:N-acetylglutamate synthase-like GNAT family acetyltransferase